MRAGKIITVILGALLAVAGFSFAVGGAAMTTIHLTQRDDDGFYQSRTERLRTPTAVLTTQLDLRTGSADVAPDHPLGTMRISAAHAAGTGDVFVGIAPAQNVDAWLGNAAYERITGMWWGPFRYDSEQVLGSGSVPPPLQQSFWVASAAGPGRQTVTWPSESGEWAVVVMNADAAPGVMADVSVGADTGLLLPVGLGAIAVGIVLLAIGLPVMLAAVRRPTPSAGVAAGPVVQPGGYPARLDGRLDPDLSRWRWLAKWFLAIPHAIVLAFLWLAVVPLTVVAGVAILFTGRYPRSIFEFNVGVMRWTWRVSYYAFNVLGTDRYPPFSLEPDPTYPADFTVDYPERLSRGLVLVKWWLLAIPHYLVVAFFTGGWSAGWTDESWRFAAGIGLIGLLVLVAVVVLTFTGRYPEPLYDFVMGMNRWCYRVLAYAGLMRDEYPPFRFDAGGTDPGRPAPLMPPPDDDPRAAELAAVSGRRPG